MASEKGLYTLIRSQNMTQQSVCQISGLAFISDEVSAKQGYKHSLLTYLKKDDVLEYYWR